MEQKPYQVSIVLDRCYGDRLATLALNGPVWIIDTPDNKAAAQSCWKQNPAASHLEGITTFDWSGNAPPEEILIGYLDTIELHHGEYSAPAPYSILQVIGATRTPQVVAELAEYGFNHLEDTPEGFRATRAA